MQFVVDVVVVVPELLAAASVANAELEGARRRLRQRQFEAERIVDRVDAAPGVVRDEAAEDVLVRAPVVRGAAHDDLLLEGDVAHLDRAHHVTVRLFDDDVLQGHLVHVDRFAEAQVIGGRLREGDLPGLRRRRRYRRWRGDVAHTVRSVTDHFIRVRRQMRRFRHESDMCQTHSLVVGEHHALLQARRTRRVLVTGRGGIVGLTDHQARPLRR